MKINEYYLKLLEDNVYRYLDNLKRQNRYNEEAIKMLNNAPTFEDFIIDSFIWSETNEGHVFWQVISRKQY